ncbi:VWA domain-containing protein [bacterium]|nr:VWA domain-containing protein [bacterium]
MRRFSLITFCCLVVSSTAFGHGVCIINAEHNQCLELTESTVEAMVENKVSIVMTTQKFHNDSGAPFELSYAFPLYEDASATDLAWEIGGTWYQATIGATLPDTIPGGSNMHPDLEEYLGETPLYFADDNFVVQPGSYFQVQITYVQLLPYAFGFVDFLYPNDYTLVQNAQIDVQRLHLELNSFRTIESIVMLNHSGATVTNDGYHAEVDWESFESVPNADYWVQYALSLDELGLYSMSSYLDPSQVPDEYGNGFFTFIAEPEPDTSQVIDKVFTLIIDRSGSMSGQKIVEAKEAASFIVNNLNEGDKFNLVSFSGDVTPFRTEHVEFTSQNQADALAWVAAISAGGGTDIGQAFQVAVPQFSSANDSTANIIIFFTDGNATWGIIDPDALLDLIDSLFAANEAQICLFNFGIGADVNAQFLTILATQHNGLSVFLGDDEVEEVITNFYLQIRNPVLLNTTMSFIPGGVVVETYPDPLPNLYQGIQMIVSGRYSEGTTLTVNLDGEQFGLPVHYEYEMELVDSTVTQYQFLTKLWAKSKIEHLLVEYYLLDPESPEAEAIMNQIIQISVDYGVLCPFTSFSGPSGIEEELEGRNKNQYMAGDYHLLGNFPNPFNPATTIRFQVNNNLHQIVMIKIYNVKGELVKLLPVSVQGAGIYEVKWDGVTQKGLLAAGGVYIYTVDFGDAILASTMTYLK